MNVADFDTNKSNSANKARTKIRAKKFEDQEKISYQELMKYIYKVHPTKITGQGLEVRREKFGVCESLGSLQMCTCKQNRAKETTQMARQIGVGPTLFLMTTKAFSQLFFFLSILYIPLIFIYLVGNPHDSTNFWQENIFVQTSLGHLSSSGLTCGAINFKDIRQAVKDRDENRVNKLTTVDLNCEPGHKLGLMTNFGIVQAEKQKSYDCRSIIKDPTQHFHDMDQTCELSHEGVLPVERSKQNRRVPLVSQVQAMKTFEDNKEGRLLKCYQNLIKTTQIVNLRDKFETSWLELEYYCDCVGKQSCSLSLMSDDMAVSKEQGDRTFWKFDQGCTKLVDLWEPKLYVVSRCLAEEVVIGKEYTDLVGIKEAVSFSKQTLGLIIVGIEVLILLSVLFFVERLEKTQQDYTELFRGNSIEMQDFTIRVQNLPIDKEYENDPEVLQAFLCMHFQEIVKNQIIDEHGEEMLAKIDPKILEVADVTFGDPRVKNTISSLTEMQKLRTKYIKNQELMDSMDFISEKKRWEMREQQEKLAKEFDREKEIFVAEQSKQEAPNSNKRSLKFAFVIFRSTYAKDIVLRAYKVSRVRRWCAMKNPFCFNNTDFRDSVGRKYLFSRWPTVDSACEPDNIKW